MNKQSILDEIGFKDGDSSDPQKKNDLKVRLLCLALMNEEMEVMSRVLNRYRALLDTIHEGTEEDSQESKKVLHVCIGGLRAGKTLRARGLYIERLLK